MRSTAQTLHAFLSSNPPAHSHLLSSASSHSFSPALASLLSILLSPSAPPAPPARSPTDPGAAHHLQDWAQLRVLAFGALLELAKGRSKRRDVEAVRDALRSDEAQEVLLALVRGAKLNEDAGEGAKVAQEIVRRAVRTLVLLLHYLHVYVKQVSALILDCAEPHAGPDGAPDAARSADDARGQALCARARRADAPARSRGPQRVARVGPALVGVL